MVVVLEEGGHPLLLCPKIDKFPPWVAMNGRHWDMVMCARGEKRKLRRHTEEESQSIMVVVFQDYVKPLKMVTTFKYPG